MEKSNFKIISHPADTGIEIEAENLEGLFSSAVAGLNATVFEKPENLEITEEKEISVKGEDIKELLVNFLTEILVLLDSEKFVAGAVEFKKIDEKNLEAILKGGKLNIEKMGFLTEIKAITYHQLAVEKKDEKWFARIIFDI